MKIVMTIMVRDEADIIGAMLEHHAGQGVDTFVITDNSSVDGTTAIIERFAEKAHVDLRHDPEHRKRQGERVTAMARDAYTVHEADWVINADADEFWFAVDRTITLREALSAIPTDLRAFPVPVTDMIGEPARRGSGLSRLVYRDIRPTEHMNEAGVFAHATAGVIHVGDPGVVVEQGNHFVNIDSAGDPDPAFAIEVLHLPWRSWDQFRRKVENAGRAYDSNPNLNPSPNHHGMRDYGRLQRGTLLASYMSRHPTPEQLEEGLERGWLVRDDSLASEALSGDPDVPFTASEVEAQRYLGAVTHGLEDGLRKTEAERDRLVRELAVSQEARSQAEAQLQVQLRRRVVRTADAVARVLRGRRRP